ncbi:MAG: tetratricopeptide repeat protein [Treponema sp.]|nr:tetratricopeptide repeat protein [Treponema sp.]
MYGIIRSGKTILFLVVFVLISVSAVNAQNNEQIAYGHFKVSLEYLMAGDYQNAILYSNQALRLLPNLVLAYLVRARAYFELNDFEKAIDDCSQVIRVDRTNSTAYSIRGNSYRKTGNMERAVTDWEAALKLNPNMEDVRNNLESARISRQN